MWEIIKNIFITIWHAIAWFYNDSPYGVFVNSVTSSVSEWGSEHGGLALPVTILLELLLGLIFIVLPPAVLIGSIKFTAHSIKHAKESYEKDVEANRSKWQMIWALKYRRRQEIVGNATGKVAELKVMFHPVISILESFVKPFMGLKAFMVPVNLFMRVIVLLPAWLFVISFANRSENVAHSATILVIIMVFLYEIAFRSISAIWADDYQIFGIGTADSFFEEVNGYIKDAFTKHFVRVLLTDAIAIFIIRLLTIKITGGWFI